MSYSCYIISRPALCLRHQALYSSLAFCVHIIDMVYTIYYIISSVVGALVSLPARKALDVTADIIHNLPVAAYEALQAPHLIRLAAVLSIDCISLASAVPLSSSVLTTTAKAIDALVVPVTSIAPRQDSYRLALLIVGSVVALTS